MHDRTLPSVTTGWVAYFDTKQPQALTEEFVASFGGDIARAQAALRAKYIKMDQEKWSKMMSKIKQVNTR